MSFYDMVRPYVTDSDHDGSVIDNVFEGGVHLAAGAQRLSTGIGEQAADHMHAEPVVALAHGVDALVETAEEPAAHAANAYGDQVSDLMGTRDPHAVNAASHTSSAGNQARRAIGTGPAADLLSRIGAGIGLAGGGLAGGLVGAAAGPVGAVGGGVAGAELGTGVGALAGRTLGSQVDRAASGLHGLWSHYAH